MQDNNSPPYWLIREPGKKHGFGSVPLDSAITSDAAVDAYMASIDPGMARMLRDTPMTATLVVLRYDEDGNPNVTEVK